MNKAVEDRLRIKIEFVLFDFGNTLAREPFFIHAPTGVPNWREVLYKTIHETTYLDKWMAGDLSMFDIADVLSKKMKISSTEVMEAMQYDCENLNFNEKIMLFAQALKGRKKTAIVTVNPDIFTHVIAKKFSLRDIFDEIVTSWEQRSLDKIKLCQVALNSLGHDMGLEKVLLIDNDGGNVQRFINQGGQGYTFRGDYEFERDLKSGKVGVF